MPEAVEDGQSFLENALIKARHAARLTARPALADDSGLVVEALSGAPGVRSARYAGDDASDQDNCRKLLSEMAGQSNRKAAFVCVLSIAVPSGPALTYEASCEGTILDAPRGSNGFGYDPVFYVAEHDCSAAQLSAERKNTLSHRAQALQQLVRALQAQ